MRTPALSCVVLLLTFSVAAGQPATEVQPAAAGQAGAAAQGGDGEAAWQPGSLDRSALPSARAFDYDFNDVQISTILGWLRRVGVEPPVRLGGRVTGWVWAQAPARGWWRLGDYRVEGELKSPLLDIDRYSIRDADVRFGYLQRNWTISRAVGQIESVEPETNQRRVLGQANLDARLPTSRTAPLHIEGRLSDVSLLDLLLTLGLKAAAPRGHAQGNFVIDTTIAQLSQPLSWNARGAISASDVQFGQLPTLAVQSDWQLGGAKLSLAHTRATVAGQTIELAAELGLSDRYDWSVQLPSQAVALTPALYQAFQMAVTPVLPVGNVQLSAASSGQLAPWRAQYTAQLGAQQLMWYGNNIANLSSTLALSGAGLRIDSLKAQMAGGTVAGQAQWPTTPGQLASASVDLQQVNLGQLKLPVDLPALNGVVTGTAQAAVDPSKLTDLQTASLNVRGTGANVSIGQWTLGKIAYALSKQTGDDALAVALDAQLAGGTIAAQGQWPVGESTTLTASVNYQTLDLAQLNIPTQLSAPAALPGMTGIVSGTAQATLDRTKLTNLRPAALQVRGTGASVRIGDYNLGQISYAASKVAEAELLDLSLDAQIAGGTIAAQAQWPTGEAVAAPQTVTATVNYQQVDLAQLSLPVDSPRMVGIVSGTAQATLERSRLTELQPAALNVRGSGAGVRIGDWGFGRLSYAVNKKPGAESIDLSLADAATRPRWSGEGTVSPIGNGNWSYDIRATTDRLDLSFAQLIRLVAPKTKLPAPIAIVLATGRLAFRGDSAQGLTATEFDLGSLEALQRTGTRWAIGSLAGRTTPSLIEISRGDFDIGGGTVQLATTWHRSGEGTDRVHLDMKNFAIATLSEWGVIALPVKVAGQADINVDVQRPAGGPSWLAGWIGSLAMTLEQLAVRGQPVGTLKATGDLNADRWQTQVTGRVFEAPLSGNFDVLIANQPQWNVSGLRGSLTWIGGAAERLIALWQGAEKAALWDGTANVRAQIDWQFAGQRTGFMRVDVPRLVYRGRPVARDFTFDAELDKDRIQLVRLDGGIAGGRVDATGNYDVAENRTSEVVVNFQRISLQEAVQLYDPDLSHHIKGRANLRVRVALVNGVDMHGVLSLHDTNWYGVPVSEAHSDFEMTASPNYTNVRLHAANIRGRAFGGRLDGDLRANMTSRRSFESRVRIRRGEVERLSKLIGTTSVIGKGKFDADLELGSPRLVTANDLQGRVDLRFEDTDAQTLPVADQLTRFVPLFGLPSTEFERGRMVGFISRGTLRMRSLALWGPQLSLLGSGNVGLINRRLDVQLVIRVGGGLTEQLASSYLAQLAATSVPPVELLLQINRLVANRAIFLRVAGTTSKPVIQPQTGRMIEQTLLRSLLEQVAPVAAVTSSVATAGAP